MAAAGLAVLSFGARPVAQAIADIVRHRTEGATAAKLSSDQVAIAEIRARTDIAIARIQRQSRLDELQARGGEVRARLDHLQRILEACDRGLADEEPGALAAVFAEIGFVPLAPQRAVASATGSEHNRGGGYVPRHR